MLPLPAVCGPQQHAPLAWPALADGNACAWPAGIDELRDQRREIGQQLGEEQAEKAEIQIRNY
jgi:hypothetical protein